MLVHSEEKEIQCNHCEEMFYTVQSMREHNKCVHKGHIRHKELNEKLAIHFHVRR